MVQGADVVVPGMGPGGEDVAGPVASLRRMVYAYPTSHRAVEDALRNVADG